VLNMSRLAVYLAGLLTVPSVYALEAVLTCGPAGPVYQVVDATPIFSDSLPFRVYSDGALAKLMGIARRTKLGRL